jgi:hypothetical protein
MNKRNRAESELQKLCEQFGITSEDLSYLTKTKKPLEAVLDELQILSTQARRFPAVVSPATIKNNFLKAIAAEEVKQLLHAFSREERDNRFVIPAAGAASRQFQLVRGLLNSKDFAQAKTFSDFITTADLLLSSLIEPLSAEQKATKSAALEIQKELPRFWNEGILAKRFAFVEDLDQVLKKSNLDLATLVQAEDIRTICEYILSPNGLNYGFLPKALMRLHAYPESDLPEAQRDCRLGLEEHIRTISKLFSASPSQKVKIHFFISEEHEQHFIDALQELSQKPTLISTLKENGIAWDDLDITWDFQHRSTDSVSLDQVSQQVVREDSGTIFLRKAGHGALLQNLSTLSEGGFWLQNVDNVLYDNPQIKPLVNSFKQIIAAYGAQLESDAHKLMQQLSAVIASGTENPAINQLALTFIQEKLCTKPDPSTLNSPNELELSKKIFKLLDRPIVVAGYVPLEPGQAGGGPFVVEVQLGDVKVLKVNTLEGSEFDGGQNNAVFRTGEFFNPVDLYITRTRFDGSLYSFDNCIDASRAFVSSKTDKTGRPILAYERPGLWNGSLALAFQVSIALPSNVFSAIKTVAGPESFLSPLHQEYNGQTFRELDFDRAVVTESSAAMIMSLYR